MWCLVAFGVWTAGKRERGDLFIVTISGKSKGNVFDGKWIGKYLKSFYKNHFNTSIQIYVKEQNQIELQRAFQELQRLSLFFFFPSLSLFFFIWIIELFSFC